MILPAIRRYLQQRGQASLADIATHFDIDPEALRGMLEVWMRKGKVQKSRATASCGGSCRQCPSVATEIYSWTEQPVERRRDLPPACPHH